MSADPERHVPEHLAQAIIAEVRVALDRIAPDVDPATVPQGGSEQASSHSARSTREHDTPLTWATRRGSRSQRSRDRVVAISVALNAAMLARDDIDRDAKVQAIRQELAEARDSNIAAAVAAWIDANRRSTERLLLRRALALSDRHKAAALEEARQDLSAARDAAERADTEVSADLDAWFGNDMLDTQPDGHSIEDRSLFATAATLAKRAARHRENGDLATAASLYQRAFRRDPRRQEWRNQAASIWEEAGALHRAEHLYREALLEDAHDRSTLERLGALYRRWGRERAARAVEARLEGLSNRPDRD